MISNGVAVLPGPRTSFLDHLIPLCHLYKIPLHCTDPWVALCAAHFYPQTKIISGPLDAYKTFYTVEPARLHSNLLQFGDLFHYGPAQTVAGFHGNPDKFRSAFWIERYADEDCVLIYGQHLLDYFKEKGVAQRLKKTEQIGNLRYQFYLQHQPFFDAITAPHLFPSSKRKTVFWAPTWTFNKEFTIPGPFQKIPDAYQVLVKIHPFMFRLYPQQVAELKKMENEQLRFLDEIPLVYPFLKQADFYLGDYSSMVYDFLVFDRPLFFTKKIGHPWGVYIEDLNTLFQAFEQPDRLAEARKKAYEYAFGEI